MTATDRPILFNGAMVRAILEGRKTQTRRPLVPQPVRYDRIEPCPYQGYGLSGQWCAIGDRPERDYTIHGIRANFHGMPGDRLWVRESIFRGPRCGTDTCYRNAITYRADYTAVIGTDRSKWWAGRAMWQWPDKKVLPSIHMPRWASRITLEITNVQAQHVQDISGLDCLREGYQGISLAEVYGSEVVEFVKSLPVEKRALALAAAPIICRPITPREWFKQTWDGIAKPVHTWDNNPWVWAITFKQVDT
jgi:hypothetical protein